MELASRIVSILLGAAVMALVLWPVTIPVGFSEVWWASRQAQSRSETPAAQPSAAKPAASFARSRSRTSPHARACPARRWQAGSPGASRRRSRAACGRRRRTRPAAAVAPKATTSAITGSRCATGGASIGRRRHQARRIAARDADATCKDETGKSWRCGAAAKAALTRLIRARAVTCELPKGGEHNIFIARCSVAGTDLSAWLVRQGWAKPKDPKEPALAKAAEEAEAERIGLWRGAE
jgi:endonuclease YncB( thermonuclease family)